MFKFDKDLLRTFSKLFYYWQFCALGCLCKTKCVAKTFLNESNCNYNFYKFSYKLQKQRFADVLQNRCFQKLRNIHRKTGLKACNFVKKRLQHRCFSVNITKFCKNNVFYRTPPVAAFEIGFYPFSFVKARDKNQIFGGVVTKIDFVFCL